VQLRAALPRLRLPGPILLGVIAFVAVLGISFFWLRDSGLFAVKKVTVTGVSSTQGEQVRSALTAAAEEMSTLHVHKQDLDDAVRGFSSVAGLKVQADFPHGMRIEVIERRPIAIVSLGGQNVPVGANGRLMRGLRADQPLPTIKATRLAAGDRVSDPGAVGAVNVLAQAPQQLRRRVERAYVGQKGLTLEVRDGPELIFGTSVAANAKWMAAARVLAEPSAAGAVYLDVRVPGRVAAGGLAEVPEPGTDPLALSPQPGSTNPQPQPENTPTLNP
jgi:cell division protein FtsQ